MKTYLGSLILLLTILIRVEFFALDGTSAYDTCLPNLEDTEWVNYEKIPAIHQYGLFEELPVHISSSVHTTFFTFKSFYSYLQPHCYPDKLKLGDGYIFVSEYLNRSNIPHQNMDEEEPATRLG